MYSAQELSAAVKSLANGFRPITDSISLDVSEVSDVDVLLTYALTARSLDEASAAVERVLVLEPENEVANAGFTWFLGVRDSADRLEQAEAACDSSVDEPVDDVPTAADVDAANESSDEEVFSTEQFSSEVPAEAKTAGNTAKENDVAESRNSGLSAKLPSAFQQMAEPLIVSKAAAAKVEQEEKEKQQAEAAAKAEQEEKEQQQAEAAAKAEQEEKEKQQAEAAAKAEQEEKEKQQAEAAAKAEQEEKEREEAIAADAEELADEVHEAAVAPHSTPTVAPANAGEKLTILTVDDSPTIRKLLMMTLEREGFHVVQAKDGVEALNKMSECNPAMILSDINMPRLDGYKLCKFIKKHAKTKHIPVIMLSGKNGVFDKLRGRMSGCDGYLTKPFESKDLLEKIRSFIGTHA